MSKPSLTVWSVDVTRVRAVCGSRDNTWIGSLQREDDPYPLQEAVRSLVMRGGPPFVGDPRSLCIVLADIVTMVGARLADNAGAGLELAVLQRADAVLARAGVSVGATALVFSGPPIDGFPEAEALPMIGHIPADAVRAAHTRFVATRPRDPDRTVDGLLIGLGGWLEVASARGEALVGIYA